VKDVHGLAKAMDQMIIGGLKLYVNIPKYGRHTGRVTQLKPWWYEDKTQISVARGRQTSASTSYAAVVAGNKTEAGQRRRPNVDFNGHTPSLSSIHLDISLKDKKWFSEAWVGRLSNLAVFDRLEEDLLWDFGVDVTPKYMGDDMVLLLGLTEDKAEGLKKEMEDGKVVLFYSLEKWHPGLRPGQRITWVQCWGIPLIAMEKTHIQKIVTLFGELVDVDDDMEAARRVDRTRVLIRTPWRPTIQHTVRVSIFT